MDGTAGNWNNEPLGRLIVRRIREWWLSLDTPNPWPDELDDEIHAIDALPVCHRCFLPFEYHSNTHFCADCGTSIGPYNNYLPLIRFYSLGEVMRSAVGPAAVLTFPALTGYVLVMFTQSTWMIPFFIFRLCRNISRLKTDESNASTARIAYVLVLTSLIVVYYLSLLSFQRSEDMYSSSAIEVDEAASSEWDEDGEGFIETLDSLIEQPAASPVSNKFYSFDLADPQATNSRTLQSPVRRMYEQKPEAKPLGDTFTYQDLRDAEGISEQVTPTGKPASVRIEIPFP